MMFINLDEHKIYEKDESIFRSCSVEVIINRMFEEYLRQFYQEHAIYSQVKELWKQVSVNIPEATVFIVKDGRQYYLTKDLHFETVPKETFEISNTAHIVLAECFETCYSEFKKIIGDYKKWKHEKITLLIIGVRDRFWKQEMEDFLDEEQARFKEILKISLKQRMIDDITPKIMSLYRSVNLENETIMLIQKFKGDSREIHSVSSKLMVEKVSYLHVGRQLEEIISRYVPVDTDFLVNRLYNHIMMPKKDIKPYIRIKTVNENGVNAILFTPDGQIPVVSNWQFTKIYLFTLIKHNTERYPNSPYIINGDTISIRPISPEEGLCEMRKLNETMFQDMTCYVEYVGKRYSSSSDFDSDNLLYELQKGRLCNIVNRFTTKAYLKEKLEKAQEEGSYAFFQVVCS